MINKAGEVIVNYSPSRNGNKLEIDPFFRARKTNDIFGSPPLKEALSNNDGTSIYYDNETNSELVFAYRQIKNKKFIPAIEWKLVFTLPDKNLFGKTERNTYILIGTVLLIWILSLISVKYFAGRVSKVFSAVAKKLGETSASSLKSSQDLRKSFENVAVNATKQANSLQQISASLSEILSMAGRTVENISESSAISNYISKEAERGNQTMEKMSLAMTKIEGTNISLIEMRKIIGQINSKTTVINGIVSKTELLSLNASIEAARAGEAGKGFAVVAEEVGDLAKVSGIAAQEIESLILESVNKIESIIEETNLRVLEGVNTNKDSTVIFKEIVTKINEMKIISDSINGAMMEQKIGIESTTEATNNLNMTTHINTESANSALKASESIERDSKEVYENMSEIESLVHGKKTAI